MCGIIGVFGRGNSEVLTKKGLELIENRGKDAQGFFNGKNFSIAHCLHSIVGRVEQPLKENGKVFASNCEIYNWEELNKKYDLKARNDSEALFKLLKRRKISDELLEELDGVYAFAYLDKNTLWLARDILGVKPLWYSHADGFSFASEKKALEKIGVMDIQELNPRKLLKYDLEKDKLELIEREFFSIKEQMKEGVEVIAETLQLKISKAIEKRAPKRKFGVLFSGGIDSTMIALVLKKLGYKFTCYTAALEDDNLKEPKDLTYAKKVAEDLGLDLKINMVKLSEVESYLEKIVPLIEDSNVVKVGVALTFYAACKEARKDGCKVLFSGLGSEEIFAGYQRHKESTNINKECVSGLLKMYERDLYRDDVVTMHHQIELRLPFLDKELVRYALKIPGKYKLKDGEEKYILRLVGDNMRLKKEFSHRKKRAAQYGSNFHKALQKLTKKNDYKYISPYLRTFYPEHNLKLGALISSGKDSIYAMYVMMRQNYEIGCMITLESENQDSYMFHTPTIELVKLQAEATNLPLITQNTRGKKEKELEDLKKALKKAKDEHDIEGVITGALFSNYQRERIEKVCDELSLKIFSPLWHINQETEMREVERENFKFIMTKIAADGLNKKWLNRVITQQDINELVKLHEKIGFNIAGEGGEFETLVLDGPIFDKKISIKKSYIDAEDEITATLLVKEARLKDK